jgi:excisionase family DNA binding protein
MMELDLDNIFDAIAERVAAKLCNGSGNNTGIKPRLYSVAQAAVYLNRSENSVRHLIAAGVIPEVRLDGRVFLDINDLDRAIEHAKQTKPAL